MAIKSMTSIELKKALDNNENIRLLDVREQDEWDAGHIAKAEFMPLSKFEDLCKNLKNKNEKIILQCRSGKRSMTAARILEENGFTDLTNLEGGIMGWMDNDFDVE